MRSQALWDALDHFDAAVPDWSTFGSGYVNDEWHISGKVNVTKGKQSAVTTYTCTVSDDGTVRDLDVDAAALPFTGHTNVVKRPERTPTPTIAPAPASSDEMENAKMIYSVLDENGDVRHFYSEEELNDYMLEQAALAE